MKRKVYSMKKLAELIPEIDNKRYEPVNEDTLVYVLGLVDIWAPANGLSLFQILAVPMAGTFFIFNEVEL